MKTCVLLFTAAPRITGPPLNTGADIGTNTTLTCRARGLPRPTIKWNFDGKPVVMTGRFTQLTSGELFIQGNIVHLYPFNTLVPEILLNQTVSDIGSGQPLFIIIDCQQVFFK